MTKVPEWVKEFFAALIVAVLLYLGTIILFSAVAEGGTLSIHLSNGFVEDGKICFQDAVETPGPPPQPVCQYLYEEISIPQYTDTNISVYVAVEVEKATLSDTILILQILSGVKEQ